MNPLIRTLTPDDLNRIVRIDEKITGRKRTAWYEGRLKRAINDSDVTISLGAEIDGTLVGALLGSVHYGEFGLPEPVAILDTILVEPGHRGHGIGRELLEQLEKNLQGLRIDSVRTEVGWDERDLVRFLVRSGFAPSPRVVLELEVGDQR